MLEREIEAFGRRIGMDGLVLGASGVLALDIRQTGRLYLEKNSRNEKAELLLYLAREYPQYDKSIPERALALCHYGKPKPYPLMAGKHGTKLVLLTRMPEQGVTAAQIEQMSRFLVEQMDFVVSGV